MYTKQDVLDKVSELLTYSISQDSENAMLYIELTQPLIDAVNDYFNNKPSQFESTINEMVFNMYCDMMERGTVTERTYGYPLPTNFPESYNDIRKCFYQFSLMTTSNSDFHAAWVMGSPSTGDTGSTGETGGTVTPTITNNTLIDEWVSELNTAHQTNLNNVKALLNWIQDSSSINMLPELFEDFGVTITRPETQDVAKSIYIDKGLLEAIDCLNLNIYIPSYIEVT